MDASIMSGKTLKAGAVSMVRNVKNPIRLARIVMSKTNTFIIRLWRTRTCQAKEIKLDLKLIL